MTTPVAHGYPDWVRQNAVADVRYYDATNTDNATYILGPFFVGAQPAVAFRLEALLNPHEVEVLFYNDAAATELLAAQEFDFAATGVLLYHALWAYGPWMTVRVTPVGANSQMSARIWGVSHAGTIHPASTSMRIVSTTANAIAAGALETVQGSRIHPDLATICVAQRAGNYTFRLLSVASDGTRTPIIRLNKTGPDPVFGTVALLGGTPEFEMINNDAAAQTWDGYLVAHSHLIGG